MINSIQLEGLTYMRSLKADKAVEKTSSKKFEKVLNDTIEADKTDEAEETKNTTKTYTNPAVLNEVSCPDSMEAYFKEASETYGVPEALLKAVAKAESNFNAKAVSGAGAQGVMQLMPGTAAGLGVKDCFNARENIMGGAKYLSQMLSKYNGSVKLALAAYNAGSGNVSKYGGVPPFTETKNYIKRIFGYLGVSVDGDVNTKTQFQNSGQNALSVSDADTSANTADRSNTTTSTSGIDSTTAAQIANSLISSITGNGTSDTAAGSSASSLYQNLLSSLASSSSSYLNLLGSEQ